MATGDAALAAGMTLVPGTAQAHDLDTFDNETRDFIAQFFGRVFAGARGATSAPTAAQVRDALQLGTAALLDWSQSAEGGKIVRRWSNGSVTGPNPSSPGEYATKQYVDNSVPAAPDLSSRVAKTGDTMTGNLGIDGAHLIVPAAAPATVSYSVAYINGDGRLSRGASSERYKKYISDIDPAALGDIWPNLTRYQMRHGDGEWKYGYIA